MSRKAYTRSVSWTTSAGISPATMRQNRQSLTLLDSSAVGRGRTERISTGRNAPTFLPSKERASAQASTGARGALGEADVSTALTTDSSGGTGDGTDRRWTLQSVLLWGAISVMG